MNNKFTSEHLIKYINFVYFHEKFDIWLGKKRLGTKRKSKIAIYMYHKYIVKNYF